MAALTYLIREKHIALNDAMAYIDGTTEEEAWGIAAGLAKEEIKDMPYRKIPILIEFKSAGMTAQDLLTCPHSFSFDAKEEKRALAFLIHQRKMTPKQALAEITHLESYQLDALLAGLTRKEVIGFNPAQIEALLSLGKFGLTEEHLRGLENLFTKEHIAALANLMFVKKLPIENAMKIIARINQEQASILSKSTVNTQEPVLAKLQH